MAAASFETLKLMSALACKSTVGKETKRPMAFYKFSQLALDSFIYKAVRKKYSQSPSVRFLFENPCK